ncbi:MAG TPA: sulfite exporter TauE/SafE family protein, partial [Vicinamibacterales bacterium]|nr:sulfite exporter TauE/SafE family protein [Vicinamibacterales bacterium]
MLFDTAVLVISALAGALASVTGFGIGSLLTPLLALRMDTRLAVAVVSVPHVVGTAVRFWLMSGGVDRRVLVSFGVTSAAGGLTGALLQGVASNRWLTVLFGGLLLFAAVSEAIGLAARMRFRGHV